ncbi:helix-turn-helix domain-containing protein [Nocardia panacis]|nr:helix-turn-helix transcriptional regulator [Nocardia panacis]
MATSGSSTAGQRIEIRRRRRGLSRKVVAGLVGRSEEWLRLVESGQRRLDSIALLTRLAEVLQIDDPTDLVEWSMPKTPAFLPNPTDELTALRHAITAHPVLRHDPAEANRDPESLTADVHYCWHLWMNSGRRHSQLADTLPAAMNATRMAHWRLRTPQTADLLAGLYHISRYLFAACGDHSTATLVADRSLELTAQYRLPLPIAASTWHLASELLHWERIDESRECALAAADLMPAAEPQAGAAVLRGALLLLAALSAADDEQTRHRLRTAAQEAADTVGGDCHELGIPFGPTEFHIAEMRIALDRHDPDRTIRLAAEVDPDDHLLVQQRVAYYVYQATAFVQRHDDTGATFALMKAASIAPEDIGHNPAARECLQYLARRGNHLVRAEVGYLLELAGLVG